jgi:hypothetical protein
MLDELLFTLETARKCLPSDADPAHVERLNLIERIVKRALEQEPDYWRNALQRVDDITSDAAIERLEGDKTHD